jgi:mono/diheme cytochrome c family protein
MNDRHGGKAMVLTSVVMTTFVAFASSIDLSFDATAADASRADGLAAWQKVYSVLTNPRCINCHTATNYPQQGDDRHRHFANVIRDPQEKVWRH